MENKLVSYIKSSISNFNDLRYFGDIVIYSSNDWLGEGIGWLTENDFTHCALRTGRDKAEGPRLNAWNLLPFSKKRDIRRFHNLESPLEEYQEYFILKHKNMSLLKRMKIKKIYSKMNLGKYDLFLFGKKALSYGFKKVKRKIGYENAKISDSRDLSREGTWLCGSASRHPLDQLEELKSSLDIDCSQIEPQNFLEDNYFEKIERGYRLEDGSWVREKIQASERNLISRILSSYTPLQAQESKK